MRFDSEIMMQFLDSRRAGTKSATKVTYEHRLRRFIGTELTSVGINQYLCGLKEGNGRRECYRVIRAAVNWMYNTDQLTTNPITAVESPKVSTKPLPCIQLEQMPTIVDACHKLRDRCIVMLMFQTGLRVSEVAAIQLHNVNLDDLSIRVTVKGGDEARAYIQPNLVSMLQEYLGDRKRGSLFQLTVRGIQDMIARLSAETDIIITAHSFRRGMCVAYHKAGQPTANIMRAGRWKDAHMVELYASTMGQDDVRPCNDRAMAGMMEEVGL